MNESLDVEKLSNRMQQQVQKVKPASNKQKYYFAVGTYCSQSSGKKFADITNLCTDLEELKDTFKNDEWLMQNIQYFELEYEMMP